MSDQFENDFEIDPTDEQAAAANPDAEVLDGAVVTADAPAEPGDDDFFAQNAAPAVPQVDPRRVITIIPSSAEARYVEAQDGEEAVSVMDLLSRAKLQFDGDFHCYLNNAEINVTATVPAGATLSVVGKVKGG